MDTPAKGKALHGTCGGGGTKEWFITSELVGLPGLPTTPQGVRKRAVDSLWTSREPSTRGVGRPATEYHISSLPAETRAAILLRDRRTPSREIRGAEPIPAERSQALWQGWERKRQSIKDEAQRRFDALQTIEDLTSGGAGKLEAYELMAEQLGESVSTIRNWIRLVKGAHQGDWLPLLAPRWTGRTAYAEYDEQVYQWFRDMYLHPSKPAYAVVFRRVVKLAESAGLTVPSLSTLIRDLERREDSAVVVLEREGERRAAELFPYLQRDRSAFHALEALNVDGHNLDIATVWPDGEECRVTVIAFQDLYSNQWVGYRLAKSESAHEMALAFLDVCDRWGVCEHLYMDNTLAMASKRMTSGAPGRKRFRDREGDPLGVLPLVGVKVHWTMTAHGQSKPIERSFGDLAERVSKHPAFTGAYLGNSPVSKPSDYGTRKVTVEEVRKVLDQELLAHNRQPNRRTEVCGGRRSFEAAFLDSYQENSNRIRRLSAAQRRLLYLVADMVTVDRRDGCVKLFGNRYWSEETVALRGKKVVVRYHPSDEGGLHKSVFVYALNGDFIGEVPCYHKAGFADAEAAQAHNRARRQYVSAKKKMAKARRRYEASEVAAMVPAEVPPMSQGAPPQEVVHVDFSVPSSLERIATILPVNTRDQEEAQGSVMRRLAKLNGVFDETIQKGRLTG